MHVFRSDREQIDPDPEVHEQLLTHLRDVGRRRNDRGTVYPLIEVQTAAHGPGGYIHPTHRRTTVFTVGISRAEGLCLRHDIREAMKDTPRLPTERSHPILGDVYVGEARATADVVRVEDFQLHSTTDDGQIRMRPESIASASPHHDLVPFTPLLDASFWQIAAGIVGHVLYDPRGALTGWGHRPQMDGHTIAFHLPSTQRCFRLTARVKTVAVKRLARLGLHDDVVT